MLQHFHDTNIDDNIVGWYQTTYLESYLNETVIEGQYHYQLDFGKKCICILFDPLKTNNGVLGVKAIRLKDSFMDLLTKVYKEQHSDRLQITQEFLAKMKIVASDMIEEIPVKITNAKLVEAFLYELEEGLELEKEGDFDALTLNIDTSLERNLESLLECVDDLTTEQNKFLYYQRRLAQQKKKQKSEEDVSLKQIQQPERLESLMITNQINNYCKDIESLFAQSITKLNLAKKLAE
jgi:translation initiation factor 3 subunit H